MSASAKAAGETGKNMKTQILILFLMITVGTVMSVQVFLSNRNTVDSIEVAGLSERLSLIEGQNTVLEEEILKKSALTYVASRASELGFVEDREITSIYDSRQIAIRR